MATERAEIRHEPTRIALEVLCQQLQPWVKEVLDEAEPGAWQRAWEKETGKPRTGPLEHLDLGSLANVVETHWKKVFRTRVPDFVLNHLRTLRTLRNTWAHPSGQDFTPRDAESLRWHAIKVLEAIGASPEAIAQLQALDARAAASSASSWRSGVLVAAGLAAVLGLLAYTQLGRPAFGRSKVEVGMMVDLKKYDPLVAHLKRRLAEETGRDDVAVIPNGGPRLTYPEAKQKIRSRQWDVVFAYSPMISLVARDEGYRFVARMFPGKPAYYKSCLFVRKDSPLRSIADVRPETVVALGQFISASSFYMPIYDLYGRTLTVRLGVRSESIKNMVRTGAADVGAAAYVALEKELDTFRIINQSRDIPGSGVYVSPELSEHEYALVKRLLDEAPAPLKTDSNYGPGEQPDYTEFAKVAQRTEEILQCVDLTREVKGPVRLSCQ